METDGQADMMTLIGTFTHVPKHLKMVLVKMCGHNLEYIDKCFKI